MDPAALRSEFPVLAHTAYLNAGTCGPLPSAAVAALGEHAGRAAAEGRARAYLEAILETRDRLRAAYAGVLGAQPDAVSVTTSTSEGIVRVLLGLDLQSGDEVLVATDEHPGLLGPLAALRDRAGITIREVPLAEVASAVSPATRLVACSHVAWTTGELAPSLGDLPENLPVLLDGAQGAGAIAVDVERLGCAFYAASGQKWLCGPVGTGMLWVAPAWRERVAAAGPTYMNLAVPAEGLGARPWRDARAHDAVAMALETAAAALAAHDVLAGFGWEHVFARGPSLADELAAALRDTGRDVAPRGASTLVSWRSDDAEGEAAVLAASGVVVRSFPGLPFVRASLGAWNDQSDVERLLAALGTS